MGSSVDDYKFILTASFPVDFAYKNHLKEWPATQA
jgi:hypothetical protein